MDSVGDRIKECSPWALLPPLYSVCVAVGLFVVYFVAVSYGHILPFTSQYNRQNGSALPPYISIAGNSPPASCIFSEIMNLAAFIGFIIAVFRYLQLRNTLQKPWLNIVCLLAFSTACFGMTLVGNFQLFVDEPIHNFGTLLTFGLGTLFCWVQSYITLNVNLRNEGFKTGIFRVLLSGSITLCVILYSTLMSQGLHMHAARGQWALVMFFLIFIGSFCIEFRHNRLEFLVTSNSRGPVSLTFSEMSRNQADSQ